MKTPTRRGTWRQVAPGTYVKNIGTYGDVKFGATARVSFIPFQTCEIMDANGVHVAIPTPADQKKYIAAAKKVYVRDTKAAAAKKLLPRETPPSALPKWKPPSQNMYGLTTLSDEPYRPIPTRESMRVEQKLVKTDEARRKRAHSIWLSGKEPGTPRDIYLRLHAVDAKRYRK
jgi:hypothetical protein